MSHPANDIYLEQRRELKEEILAMRIYKDFEDFLADKFSISEGGYILDDDWPEAFEDWIQQLDISDVIKWADEYAASKTQGKD